MRTRTLACTRDVAVRSKGHQWDDLPLEGAPKRGTLYAGLLGGRQYRSFLDFDWDFDDVGVLRRATLVLHTSYADHGAPTNPKARVQRLQQGFEERSNHTAWDADSAVDPSVYTASTWHGSIATTPQGVSRIDITTLVGRLLPASKSWIDSAGKVAAGTDAPNVGIVVLASSQSDPASAFQFYSRDEDTSAWRPYIEIAYDPPNYRPDRVSTLGPSGTAPRTTLFRGEFTDPNGDRPAYIQRQVRKVGATEPLTGGTTKHPFDLSWSESGGIWTWTLPALPSSVLKSDVQYEWRARGWDPSGAVSDWSNPWRKFTLSGTGPSVTAVAMGSLRTLQATRFAADWSVEAGEDIISCRLRLRRSGDPWTAVLWDESFSPMTDEERSAKKLLRWYHGPYLGPGTYVWQARVTDSQGLSAWSAESTLTLTVGSEVDDDGDGAGPPANVTGYARARPSVRIMLRKADAAGRGPGTVVGIIEDATNLGFRTVYNAPGEMYFTLPATHPQAGVCEPWQTHYAVQQYRNGAWFDLANGWLTDFDAGENDIVVYGLDYLAALSKQIDPRFPDKENIDATIAQGGARYPNMSVHDIIVDQLDQSRLAEDSNVGFIFKGNIDPMVDEDGHTTNINIYVAFKQRLDFIRGIIDSHKQGSGRRTRLKARYDRVSARWEWDLREHVGVDRDNLRLEYGSLAQNFRVVAMGVDWATKVHVVATQPNNVVPMYKAAPDTSDFWTSTFGLSQTTALLADISDENDLARRVKQMRAEAARVGKQVWVAIRVHGIDPFDGYDLMDNIPLDIDRGMVETERYGSGYWTIHGVEWRLFPDGHDELSLIIRPRIDLSTPDADLLPSVPVHISTEWSVGTGAPVGSASFQPGAQFYYDQTTGRLYERTPGDPTVWVDQGLLQGPPGPPGGGTADYTGEWRWEVGTTGTPTSGDIGINAAAWAGATYVHVNEQTTSGASATTYLGRVKAGNELRLQVKNDPSRYGWYVVTGIGQDMGAWWRFPVTLVGSSGAMPADTTIMTFSILGATDLVAPAAPTALTLTGGSVTGTDGTVYSWLDASWTPPADLDLTAYEVQFDTTGTWVTPNTRFMTEDTLSIRLAPLLGGTLYYVRVRAMDLAGNKGAWSSTATATPPGVTYTTGIFSTATPGAGSLAKPVCRGLMVEIVGGGGAGGGTPATGASDGSAGGGGGGGCYGRRFYTGANLAALPATLTWDIGAGGVGASAAGGGNGGATTFDGGACSVPGGTGGSVGTLTTTSNSANGGQGGSGSTGMSWAAQGGDGGMGRVIAAQPTLGNIGGDSYFGGVSLTTLTGATNGSNYGGGGSGANAPASTAARAGGNGANGFITLTWW